MLANTKVTGWKLHASISLIPHLQIFDFAGHKDSNDHNCTGGVTWYIHNHQGSLCMKHLCCFATSIVILCRHLQLSNLD